jgi:uncharacterized membrane protein YtjA (UPF0391 family)
VTASIAQVLFFLLIAAFFASLIVSLFRRGGTGR